MAISTHPMAEPRSGLITEPMTFEAAARLDPDEFAGDIEQGEWVPVSKNTWLHGVIIARICLRLGAYLANHPEWSLSVGDPGTRLHDDPDTLRGPDLGLVHQSRVPTGKGQEGWLQGAPDLAIEVVGDGQSASQVAKKALEFLRAGGRAVWVLDPGPRLVMVFTSEEPLRILGPEDTLDGGEVLPGFSCPVAELFE